MNNSQSGFTLIELMVVVVIIGILAAIALPNFLSMQDRAKEAEVKSNIHTIQLVIEDYKTLFYGQKPSIFNTYTIGAQPTAPTPGVLGSGIAIVMEPIKNPFTGNKGANVIQYEGLPSPLPANVQIHGIITSGITQGNIGYTEALGQVLGNSYCLTGAGKLSNNTVQYVAIILEGQ